MTWRSTVYALVRHPRHAAILMMRSDRVWGPPTSRLTEEVEAGHADQAVEILERRLERKVWTTRPMLLQLDQEAERTVVAFEAHFLDDEEALPSHGRWVDRAQLASLRLREGLRPFLEGYLDALTSGIEPVERPPWCRPGWRDKVVPWIEDAVRPHRLTGLDQVKNWSISCVLRVRTTGAVFYFKTSAPLPLFVNEVAVSRRLAEMFPGWVLDPVAVEEGERWMLTADLGLVDFERGIDDTEAAFRRLARLHVASASQISALLEAGCHDRRLAVLAGQLEPLLTDDRLLGKLDEDDRSLLRSNAGRVDELCGRLAQLDVPPTLVHGDFHMENLGSGSADSAVIFDWSDACVSHPFFDLQSVEWYSPDDRRRLLDGYLEAWKPWVAPSELAEAVALARVVRPFHHAVSYKSIADHLEPQARPELDFAHYFLRSAARALREAS